MAKCEKILVAGFSGAGKTSLLKFLECSAPDAAWTFADLDQLVTKTHRTKDLASLIETHGWEKFRLWERQALEGWLKEEGPAVLALGGGTLSQLLLDIYKPTRKIGICYLHVPFEDAWERLHLEGTEARPLVKLGKGELQRTYLERQQIFSQIPWRLENPKGTDLTKLSEAFWAKVSGT